jgi:hypothetical protein
MKINSKEYFHFLKEKGYSTQESLLGVRVAMQGETFVKACEIAEDRHGENLMPDDCVVILEECYGKKMERMKPKTIYEKVYHMLLQATDSPDEEGIMDSVKYYMNS